MSTLYSVPITHLHFACCEGDINCYLNPGYLKAVLFELGGGRVVVGSSPP